MRKQVTSVKYCHAPRPSGSSLVWRVRCLPLCNSELNPAVGARTRSCKYWAELLRSWVQSGCGHNFTSPNLTPDTCNHI